ncbi:MAG: MBL fold metallo-hydrolase [Desulfitobacteriaceae bacterium]
MNTDKNMKITFWGARGSRPVPGKDTLVFGGNTPCVSLEIDDKLLIFDSGTGICNLGNKLIKDKKPVKAHIFISHTHWDHIQGFPFFTPAFMKGNEFIVYGQNKTNLNFANLMKNQMVFPHFPVQFEQMAAKIVFVEVDSGDEIAIEDIIVRTLRGNHPGGCLYYRVDYKGKSFCYVSDIEHYSCVDNFVKSFIEKSDIVIYDTNFTDSEYEGTNGYNTKIGWGHSTWQEGIKLVKAAGADTLVLFHHANHRNDEEMLEIEIQAKQKYPKCIAAREGNIIII